MTNQPTGYSFFNKEITELRNAVSGSNAPLFRGESHSPAIVKNEMSALAAAHLAELSAVMSGGSCSITGCSQSIAGMFKPQTPKKGHSI